VLDANIADGTLTSGLTILLICGALCTDFRAHQASVQTIGFIVLAMFLLVVGTTGGFAIRERIVPHNLFHWFITHHKAGAAAQARYVHLLLSMRGKKVFIDSDDLQDLDTLFDTVRVRTKNLCVYATAETLKRPWCAGEIVVAAGQKINIVLVRTPGFADPTPEEMMDMWEYLDPSRTVLSAYGMGNEDVRRAYEYLLTNKVVRVMHQGIAPGLSKFNELETFLLSKTHTHDGSPLEKLEAIMLTKDIVTSFSGTVVISSDPADEEATAAAGILCSLIQPQLQQQTEADTSAGPLCRTVDYHNLNDRTFGSTGSEQVVDLLCTLVVNARAVLVPRAKACCPHPGPKG
jgi:hypothetical protein